ncbi:Transcriptional activator protein CzcR [Vibrio aerogenes CECT 7868]|uniref:Transcriptional activator protein CzcR n=1 Tax=Vibrio aerogenes CECT 7868 TaxID=1216006 RepID=A0A1M5ZSM4_9VIBR|nr:response regulator transcription factor [Vibrio aerogenes]SHI27212.1 Transcriptional activator protein CzcR [Vibrio aerogenes CECT 7868]
MRVLVVEDELPVSHWIGSKLHSHGHHCKLSDNGKQALQLIRDEVFDVILLDNMLPEMNGIDVLTHLAGTPHPPVLILSANDQISDRIRGLKAGADDYLGKPFDFIELLLRLERLHDRTLKVPTHQKISIGYVTINLDKQEVCRHGKKVLLTGKEFKILQVLAEYRGKTVTRNMLLEKVWGYHFDPQTNILDVHLSKLRNKLNGSKDEPPIIRTIRSVGYALGYSECQSA